MHKKETYSVIHPDDVSEEGMLEISEIIVGS